ncbi:YhcN/YlaJ family sporulation lipoprotein [Peribacillus sp. SCS-37]|uniref:YhcN/YlaJ family sporulation lipoprotein n=1 Tax=Paraperibacillus esterisolvens TaxID=3115296 RepID=UPI003906145A
MKKSLSALCLGLLLILSACSSRGNLDNGNNDNPFKNTSRTNETKNINQNYNVDNHNNDKSSRDFGFVRLSRTVVNGETVGSKDRIRLDREQLADIITRLAVQNPQIDEAATLVTDEEALIAYKTGSENREEAADQVKRTAMSVLPRYFHVYVTDNPGLMQNIENFADLNTHTDDINYMLQKTIVQMKRSPQGKTVIPGENANGETKADMNAGSKED